MKGEEFSGYVFYGKNGISFSSSKEETISENIKRILSTRKGERLCEPEFGSRVKELLFLPQARISELIDEVKSSVERWEPRVQVVSCELTSTQESLQQDVIYLKLELLIKSTNEIINTEVNI